MNTYFLVKAENMTDELSTSGVGGKSSVVHSLDKTECILEFKKPEHFSVFEVEGRELKHAEAVALVKSEAYSKSLV